MAKIILVEDDINLGRTLSLQLRTLSHQVQVIRTVADFKLAFETLSLASNSDLYILDWHLPDGNGQTLCELIRVTNKLVPILFLTGNTNEENLIKAFEKGANDYVRKPFSEKELIARIRRLLGVTVVHEELVRLGDLTLSLSARKAHYQKKEISITRKDFDILAFLIQNAGNLVTREMILNVIDADGSLVDRTVDSHLSHLRRIFEKAGITDLEIQSIYGKGYKLDKAG